jgi:CheY-like chemotaxis protein
LPAAAAAPAPESPAQPSPGAPTPIRGPHRHQILYIEDNPVNAMIIGELISRRDDLTLHVADDGASGVAQAVQRRPDLVLLDMQLPDMDGFEVLRRLRADATTAGIPCIALSANAMPEDIQRALRAGMSDYWTKPLDFKAFFVALDALFGPAG